MTMGGGCHGCSMSKMTMLDGVQTMLSEAIPAVQRVQATSPTTPPARTRTTPDADRPALASTR